MVLKALPVVEGEFNLQNYDEAYKQFNWSDTEREFSWFTTGKVNMAYEAIDRHVETYNKNKVALYYKDDQRNEKYTFQEMKKWTNKAANVLKEWQMSKRVIVYSSLCLDRQSYILLCLERLNLEQYVGPLFEAFMEGAVKERLEDSKASVIVTTLELLPRVPVDQLPHLQSIFLVGENIEEKDQYYDFNSRLEKADSKFDIVWVDTDRWTYSSLYFWFNR